MKSMTAREARERMGQPDKKAMKLAKSQFKEIKKEALKTIKIKLAEEKTEIDIKVEYPIFIFKEPEYSREVYKKELIRLVESFFTSRGYSVYFQILKSPCWGDRWSNLFISWKTKSK